MRERFLRISLVVLAGSLLPLCVASHATESWAQEVPDPFRLLSSLTRYEPAGDGAMRVVSDLIVDAAGATTHIHGLAPGSLLDRLRVLDLASGEELPVEVASGTATIQLGRPLPERAEQRLRVVEHTDVSAFEAVGDRLVFRGAVPPGRVVVAFPASMAPNDSSAPAQWRLEGDALEAGFINVASRPLEVTIRARDANPMAAGEMVAHEMGEGDYRAEDPRNIVYWVEDAFEGRFRLALELIIDHPGQRHAYSVLNKSDNITDPATLDVDRGVELPTRIVDGSTANEYGDAPVAFAPDDHVFVADLGYAVPDGGSARVRLFQSASEPEGLRVLSNGHLRWDRFLARLRTRVVLPARWQLTSVDQPAYLSRNSNGELVIDWINTHGGRPSLTVTARPAH